MYDRSHIMKSAWASYHNWHAVREMNHGPMKFDRVEFAFRLQLAWADAKECRLSPIERQRVAIESQIDALKYKSAHINIEPRRRELQAQLSALAA